MARVIRSCSAAVALALQLAPNAAQAEAFEIDHAGVSCVVAERFPRFEARFDPAEAVREARVHFRPVGGRHWYSVAMSSLRSEGYEAEAGFFQGVLPKPKRSLEQFAYYIEVIGEDFEPSRTPEYAPRVVAGIGACQDGKTAVAVVSALVRVTVPLGAPAASLVPAGFSAAGVTQAVATASTATAGAGAGAGGGGMSATTLGIAAGAAAATVAGVVVATGGEDPPPQFEDGFFEGTIAAYTDTFEDNGCTFEQSVPEESITMSIGQGRDEAVISIPTSTLRALAGDLRADGAPCADIRPADGTTAVVPLTVSGARITGSGRTPSGNSMVELVATRDGTAISGTYTWSRAPGGAFDRPGVSGWGPNSVPMFLTKSR